MRDRILDWFYATSPRFRGTLLLLTLPAIVLWVLLRTAAEAAIDEARDGLRFMRRAYPRILAASIANDNTALMASLGDDD